MNAPTVDPAPADQLLVRINTAFAAVNEAEKTAETAKTELVCHGQRCDRSRDDVCARQGVRHDGRIRYHRRGIASSQGRSGDAARRPAGRNGPAQHQVAIKLRRSSKVLAPGSRIATSS